MLFTASRTLLNLIAACIKNHNTANKYPISIKTKNALSIAKATNVNNIIEKAKNSKITLVVTFLFVYVFLIS